jgi:hypothetical protein
MIDQKDVQRTAKGLHKTLGPEAETECTLMVEKFRRRGDTIGAEVWETILSAVQELEDKKGR